MSWLLMLLCGGFIVYVFTVNQEQLHILTRVSPPQLALLVLLHLGYLGLHGYRHLVVLERCSKRALPFRPWFRIYVLGRFLDLIVPQMGNLYRGLRLKKDFGVSYTNFASAFLSFAWISILLNLIMALLVILVLVPGLRIGSWRGSWVLFGLAAGIMVAPILLDWCFRVSTLRPRVLAWLHEKAGEVMHGAVDAARDKHHLAWVALLAVAQFLYTCLIFYVCFVVFDIRVGIGALVLFYVLFQISTYVNLTPGNLGFQEVVFGLLGDMTGIGMAEGILVSVLLRVTGYVSVFALAVPMGGLHVLRRRSHYRP